jgi:hypothetical protein
MTKIAGSGSISQRHGSADPDPDPDPYQNVMDPQHCTASKYFVEWETLLISPSQDTVNNVAALQLHLWALGRR